MKVVFISNLFPDTAEPYRGLDNSCLLQHLARHCEVRVISPRPSLPLAFGRKAAPHISCPVDARFEPRYPTTRYIPKVGSPFNHLFFARAIRRSLEDLRSQFPFDVVLCSWIYPDGCGVARVASLMETPFVIIAQGSDVHVYLRMVLRRRLIRTAANESARVITRSRKLAELLHDAGVPMGKLCPIYNGVDLNAFCPADRQAARLELGLPPDAQIILFVGNFYEVKNPLLLLSAHAELCRRHPDGKFHVVMIGDGPLREPARRKADADEAGAQVVFAGRQPPDQVARYLQASDLLCVPSHNEGVPNVILEAFASGVPVVATSVGGVAEVLSHEFLGRLVEPANVQALVGALAATLAEKPDATRIIQHARQFSWTSTAQAYFSILKESL